MEWLSALWPLWECAAPFVALVEFGLLIVGTLWTWWYRRTLTGKIGSLTDKVEAQTNEIHQLRAHNSGLAAYLVNKLGPDEKNAVRISGIGSAEVAMQPAVLTRGTVTSGQGDQGRE